MSRRIGFYLTAAIVALTTIGAVVTTLDVGGRESRTQTENLAQTAATAPPPGSAAMRAYVDPETGRLRVGVPPAGVTGARPLDARTENALRRDDAGLVEVRHPNGAVSIDLQGRFRSVSVLKKGPNGETVVCTDNRESADRALEEPEEPEVK